MQSSLFDSGPQPPATADSSDYIQPNLGHALRVWWAFYWPTQLIAVVLTFWLGLGIEVLIRKEGYPRSVAFPVVQGCGYLVAGIAGMFIMNYVLSKRFREFRVALVTPWGTGKREAQEVTLTRTLRVWWIYVWRTTFYTAIAWVVLMLPLGTFLHVIGRSATWITIVQMIVSLMIGGAVGLFVIYSNILDEEMGDFRVVLLPLNDNPSPTPTAFIEPVIPPR